MQHDGTTPAGGRPVGFWCPVCGYLVPAGTRRPGVAPACAGSTARTGRPHELTRMQLLLINRAAPGAAVTRYATRQPRK